MLNLGTGNGRHQRLPSIAKQDRHHSKACLELLKMGQYHLQNRSKKVRQMEMRVNESSQKAHVLPNAHPPIHQSQFQLRTRHEEVEHRHQT